MRILVTGGGTGGHIYPALALIKRIKELHSDAEFLYVGTFRGLESTIVPEQSINFEPLKVEGFKRSLNMQGIVYNVKTVGYFIKAIRKSKKIIKEFEPDVVIGTGGYVSAPVCYAAAKSHIPTIIHEQNSVAGITNKFLAKYVSAIAICFEDARAQFQGHEEKVHFTGNPRAQEVAYIEKNSSLTEYGLKAETPTVLIFGGSRGAYAINEAVIKNGKALEQGDYQVLFVTGRDHYESILSKWKEMNGELSEQSSVKVVPYIDDLPNVFASVSLVVSRSGATTLAELTSLGVPSILIPSPNVTEDHQTRNARSLSDADAAVLIKETELNGQMFIDSINKLMTDESKRSIMTRNAKALGVPDASDRLIHLMLELISKED
ncbi:undecaprenyldiphospho-muramoylpentapeptide beta-N-acetylglucosaminyltransferase [Alkalibacterium olivapovliticus]|uniref:UDP-N-acetylglucosamine--N-acetylmuramyl-(pentapeptide) pyrophosphoryl-undecaprenol N-acetylglucosamine transferase n=1 Tax=Alkalibacterium olivapovliticus TaxID=99907 RepID=A0A2T0WBF7_9LACT|nr:undecaprenyldiphospho-muramoylpentapeptide beta-N-acetylglucosaminyltransferase [Alkalibacterium olivapovliticus]PRY83956.1 UDP-N-acetylglucosamine--N-acetylmuramyl-(pentapeptide) pyrophosphoryl-undecaprenol N-acetylglucosamine transferase [Alkalibacterium olivapovliticus]